MIKPVRKIKHRSHKCFSLHSIINDGSDALKEISKGKGIGSKILWSKDYRDGDTDRRSKKEILNSVERKESISID